VQAKSRAKAVKALATPGKSMRVCPKCGAQPGQRCFSITVHNYGKPTSTHLERRDEYLSQPFKSRVQLYIESVNAKRA